VAVAVPASRSAPHLVLDSLQLVLDDRPNTLRIIVIDPNPNYTCESDCDFDSVTNASLE
jgi:hypothetical protein